MRANEFTKQGITEGFDKEAGAWRDWQFNMLPRQMKMLSRLIKKDEWKPSEEDHIAAIEAGYNAMRNTGDVKDAAKAISDTFKEIQSRQGVTEDTSKLNYIGNCTDDDVIEHLFGDATGFAQAVDEYGDDFELDDLVVKYDPDSDIHSFYYKQQGVAESIVRIKVSELSVNRNTTVHKWQLRSDKNFGLINEVPGVILKNVSVSIDQNAYDNDRKIFAYLQGEKTDSVPRGLKPFPIVYQRNGTYPFIDKSTGDPIENVAYVEFTDQGKVIGYQQGVVEGKIINTYLWHGSRHKNEMLHPRQAVDTGGAAGSNQNAIYATSDPKIAIAMGLATSGSDTGMFPNDPQMVLFSGDIRKGKYVYLHKLPMNGPDGKPQFVQGGNSREFHSLPNVKEIKPIEIKEIPVNKYLNLIRKATKQDWALRKKYMKKQDVTKDNVDEMALQTYKTMGDFSKPGPFTGADKKLVPHPKNIEKATRFFEQTPFDFRLFFSHLKGTGKYSEHGPMSHDQIRQVFGQDAEEIINGSEDAITVVYVGNKGDSKVMLTPWMMAHRFGHAINAGARNKNWTAWGEAEKYFFGTINDLLKEYYSKEDKNPSPYSRRPNRLKSEQMSGNLTLEYNVLFNTIGTQRSSSSGQIRRPYEFMYELLAQYIGTGKITLNPFPENLKYKLVYGNPTMFMNIKPEYRDEGERKQAAESLAYTMELLFNDVLGDSVGKIFVM